jgi:hypothetical protein
MKRNFFCISMILLVVLLNCTSAWAQATAQINGTVRDQTGAVLPGADVTATQIETGIVRTTISNETGLYVLPNLPLGPYRLEVALPGFRTFVQSGIVLQVNSNPLINAVLQVGQVTEQVEVQANAAMVETRAQGVGQVIENERILELPLNGRNVADLIVLAGAAVQTGTTGNRSFSGSPILSVGGSLGFGASYKLDGAMHNDPYNGVSMPLPFPDALQEFKVETSALTAQNPQGTAVNSVTKSGTNEFHGDLFEFVRNDLFNARPYFSTTGSTLKRNQFGGTVGGPIVRNKLFVFGGYQGTTLRQDPADIKQYVPTAAMLAGDFTAFASAACNAGRAFTLRAPFAGNRIDPSQFSRAALNIASRLPKTSSPCGEVVFGRRADENNGQVVAKVDYQMSNQQSMFGRYMYTRNRIPHPFDFTPDNALNTAGRGFNNLAQAYTFGDTYLVSPNMVSAFRLAVNRVNVQRRGAVFFGPADVGINIYSYMPKYLGINVTGGFATAGGTMTDSTFRTTTYQLGEDISLVQGAHQFSFGVNLAHGRNNTNSNSSAGGAFAFNGQDTGLGMADFLLGRTSSFTQGTPIALYVQQTWLGVYGQDTWKVGPKLTLNYGIRWDPYLPQSLQNSSVYNFDYDRFRQGIRSTVFKNAPAGFYYVGDPGFPGKSGVEKQWMNFTPRVGLAWDVNGDGRTSVRASYGLAYDFIPLQWRIDASHAPPWGNELSIPSPVGGLENPWLGIPGGNPFPTKYGADPNAVFAAYGSYITNAYDIHTPYASSWNLSVQKQLAANWLFSSSYIGSQRTHLWTSKPVNPAVYLPGGPCTLNGVTYNPCSSTSNTNQRRRLNLERPQELIGILDEFESGGTQSYHGMLLSVQRRAASGVVVSGNYTLSHCIGDFADENGMGPNAGQTYQDPLNRDKDRGNCGGDRRHIFNMTAVAETPRFANDRIRMIATGWKLSGIYRWSTGSWLTITPGTDRALNGTAGSQRANQILVDPYRDKSAGPYSNFLNPSAFAVPATGTHGNMGRANIQGVSVWQFDASLSRTFQIRENQRLEFRAEAYNLTNSFRPQNPAVGLNSNTFGQITTSLDPRIMQFALKYLF